MKTDNTSSSQKRGYFLFQEWVADEMNSQGIPLAQLVIEVQPRPTKESLHEIFKAILYAMYQKTSTTGMTREEMNNCLDVYMEALARINVHLPFPDQAKRTLLEYYS